MKLYRFLAVTFIFSILLCGCSSHKTPTALNSNSFNPESGSFNLRVILFQLNDNGFPRKVESGTVPIEKEAIRALKAAGYTYSPDGNAKYNIEARLGSIDPKLAILPSQQHVGLASGPEWGISDFNEYPVMVKTWSPEIQRIRSGPGSCIGTIQILVREHVSGRDDIVYQSAPSPHPAPYEMGCPFSSDSERSEKLFKDKLLKLFSR